MVGKYAGITPYNFTMNNPVVLVDPDGQDPLKRAKRYARRNNLTQNLKYGVVSYETSQNGGVSLIWSGMEADGTFTTGSGQFNRNFGDKISSVFEAIFSGLGKNGSGQQADRGGNVLSTDGNGGISPQGAAIKTDVGNINNDNGKWYTNVDNFPFTSLPNTRTTNPLLDALNFANKVAGDLQAGQKVAGAIMDYSNQKQNKGDVYYQTTHFHPYGLKSIYGHRLPFSSRPDSIRKADSLDKLPNHKVYQEGEF